LYKGYKEFFNYLFNPEPSQNGFSQAVDRMKLSTRQYAKRQISWIRNKLIPVAESANREDMSTPFFLLDATGLIIPSLLHCPLIFLQSLDRTGLTMFKDPPPKSWKVNYIDSFVSHYTLVTYPSVGFLRNQQLPVPKSLSARAHGLLTVKEKDVRCA